MSKISNTLTHFIPSFHCSICERKSTFLNHESPKLWFFRLNFLQYQRSVPASTSWNLNKFSNSEINDWELCFIAYILGLIRFFAIAPLIIVVHIFHYISGKILIYSEIKHFVSAFQLSSSAAYSRWLFCVLRFNSEH